MIANIKVPQSMATAQFVVSRLYVSSLEIFSHSKMADMVKIVIIIHRSFSYLVHKISLHLVVWLALRFCVSPTCVCLCTCPTATTGGY